MNRDVHCSIIFCFLL